MKRAVTFAAVLTVALPLLAGDAKPKDSKKTTTAQAAAAQPGTAVKVLDAPAPDAQLGGDSPLVAAAKRTGRLGKKPAAVVITNDDLVKTGGHFTTTSKQDTLPLLPPEIHQPRGTDPTPNAGAQKARADEAEHDKLIRALQRQYENDSLNPDSDPSTLEHHMEQANQKDQKKQ